MLIGCQQKEVLSGAGYMSVSGIEVQSQTVAEVASRSTDDIIWTVELCSRNDIDFTQKIKRSCDDLGICLLDHLIVGKSTYYSFREEREDFDL